ncbi:UDP-N-acetylglucosamine diphosphorylase 1-like isoform X1 [Chenopodium quinoa]|uniref:UDP-N-acetylglucosamine diphosphorylase 1-like isoform X1 n=2 Tax=Chenopodium quinoa TaxID=63459 RepID=UPI000B790EC1|nr:UDP-N-acetylglucosamine diphosphorylase 1-like isoform X1 [Chenopodium quinoa]
MLTFHDDWSLLPLLKLPICSLGNSLILYFLIFFHLLSLSSTNNYHFSLTTTTTTTGSGHRRRARQTRREMTEIAAAETTTVATMADSNGVNAMAASPPQALLERLKDYGQEDTFAFWNELSSDEREHLIKDIESLDLPRIDRIIRCSFRSQGLPAAAIEPVSEDIVSTVEHRTIEDREKWWKMGLKAIHAGKLAVILLSGGQGTRLGSSDPKGCFNIGLPSRKSLFQLQAERILCVQRLAAQFMNEGSADVVPIHWYIMTSPFTDEATRKFFESHKFFGLEADQVTFFQQGTIPCISMDGRFIMETPYKMAKAPDGNGGVYTALKSSRLLEDMAARGVKYVDCYGVDNALVRVADPTFLGYFIDKNVSAAAKVVKKAYPQEKVGVFVRRGKGGPLDVVEYSELDPSVASAVNQETGRLRFCWSNVCLHMFTLDFLNSVANGLENDSIYHLAEKKIPSVNGYTMGLKLEQFIFDAFTYSPSTALFEVLREEEFAPVKNANGANYDTPDSARLLVLRLHARWVIAAGGFLTHSVPLYSTGVEVSPLCSYTGENLEAICRGRTFHAPCEITF